MFFLSCYGAHRDLHSFPTRRSSDLILGLTVIADKISKGNLDTPVSVESRDEIGELARSLERSEEHTSELQSRGHLVCRLLLEKKKLTHRPRLLPELFPLGAAPASNC